jgi:acetate kinase
MVGTGVFRLVRTTARWRPTLKREISAANAAGAAGITTPGSRTSAWVIPTNEDLMIARHIWRLTEGDAAREAWGRS